MGATISRIGVIVRCIAHAAPDSVCTHSLTSEVGDASSAISRLLSNALGFFGPRRARFNIFHPKPRVPVPQPRALQSGPDRGRGTGSSEQVELVIPLVSFLRDPLDGVHRKADKVRIRIRFREVAQREPRQPASAQGPAGQRSGRAETFGGENSVADIGHHQRPNARCEILRPHLFRQLESTHAVDNGMPGSSGIGLIGKRVIALAGSERARLICTNCLSGPTTNCIAPMAFRMPQAAMNPIRRIGIDRIVYSKNPAATLDEAENLFFRNRTGALGMLLTPTPPHHRVGPAYREVRMAKLWITDNPRSRAPGAGCSVGSTMQTRGIVLRWCIIDSFHVLMYVIP